MHRESSCLVVGIETVRCDILAAGGDISCCHLVPEHRLVEMPEC